MRTIKRKTKIYSVDWYHGDHCYRTTMGCTWEDVKDCKRAAKLMGETIKYEHYDTKENRDKLEAQCRKEYIEWKEAVRKQLETCSRRIYT